MSRYIELDKEIVCQMCGKVVKRAILDGCIVGEPCCPYCEYHLF